MGPFFKSSPQAHDDRWTDLAPAGQLFSIQFCLYGNFF